jgi:hypothetical protein
MDGRRQLTRYARAGAEPALNEMLDEPIVRLVMERDGVARREVRELIEQQRERHEPYRGFRRDE